MYEIVIARRNEQTIGADEHVHIFARHLAEKEIIVRIELRVTHASFRTKAN